MEHIRALAPLSSPVTWSCTSVVVCRPTCSLPSALPRSNCPGARSGSTCRVVIVWLTLTGTAEQQLGSRTHPLCQAAPAPCAPVTVSPRGSPGRHPEAFPFHSPGLAKDEYRTHTFSRCRDSFFHQMLEEWDELVLGTGQWPRAFSVRDGHGAGILFPEKACSCRHGRTSSAALTWQVSSDWALQTGDANTTCSTWEDLCRLDCGSSTV